MSGLTITKTQYRFTVYDVDFYELIKVKDIGTGRQILLGTLKNGLTEIQSIKFEKKYNTKKDFLNWLKRNKYISSTILAPKGVVIYSEIMSMIAKKGVNSLWKDKTFKHDFDSPAEVIGLSNGDILIRSTSGKRLWEYRDGYKKGVDY